MGLDVHKRPVVACVLRTHDDGTGERSVRTFGPRTANLLALRDGLSHLDVAQVALESTGVSWRPVFNILEAADRQIVLGTPQHLQQVPGRKPDVKDAAGLADRLRQGFLRASFLPPAPSRTLREVTRSRKTLGQQRTAEVNRLQQPREGATSKLAAVATDVLGVSGREMLATRLGGAADPTVLAELARGRLRATLPALRHARTGRVQAHHRVLLAQLLAHIDCLEESIAELQAEIEHALVPFTAATALRQPIPGGGAGVAAALVAEIGTDPARFPSAKHLASWAGVGPGNKPRAGTRLNGKTTKGTGWLRGMLALAAWSIARSPGTSLHAQ